MDEIVFIEVKTRKTCYFGNPSESVTRKKLNSMNLVANSYLKSMNFQKDYRFDIIAIEYLRDKKNVNGFESNSKISKLTNPTIEHFENISWNM